MIAGLWYLVAALIKHASKREPKLSPSVLVEWKRERYDLNPALRVRTRIPKVGKL